MSIYHFTTQQLQGGGKYSTKCKIGNWYEDKVLEEIKYKNYIKKREDNKLTITSKENKYSKILKRLELFPFKPLYDNNINKEVRYLTANHYCLIQNLKTNGFIVGDTDDKNPNFESAYGVTTNPLMNFACPRNLIKFEKFNNNNSNNISHYNSKKSDNSNDSGDILKFGDKIVIICHDLLHNETLYLFSQLISPQSYSRFSRNQEVLLNSKRSYSCCWTIEHVDPTLRFSKEGQPILLDEPFIIRHCATGRLLASDLIDYNNDYGREYEVCCFNFLSNNKYQTLDSEKDGKLKINTLTKYELDQNIWRIVDKL